MTIKRCNKCGAVVKMFKDCICDNCEIKCCGENMKAVTPNSTDASVEKHVPEYEVVGDYIKVRVNHVMEQEHFIEWVSLVYDNEEHIVDFKSQEKLQAIFKYVKGATIYSYCNKHMLWPKMVE